MALSPSDLPDGPFDLVVASEVLYYFARRRAAARCSTPGGRAGRPAALLLAVHWRPPTRTYPLRGDAVHALLGAARRPASRCTASATERYRLDLLRAPHDERRPS